MLYKGYSTAMATAAILPYQQYKAAIGCYQHVLSITGELNMRPSQVKKKKKIVRGGTSNVCAADMQFDKYFD